jgi:hypothetical protein
MEIIKQINLFPDAEMTGLGVPFDTISLEMHKEKCTCGCNMHIYKIWKNYSGFGKTCLESILLEESKYDYIEDFWHENLNRFINDGWNTRPPELPEPPELISSEDRTSSEEDRKKALQRLGE